MAVKPIEYFKTLFVTGYTPTQQDYTELFNTIGHLTQDRSLTKRSMFKFTPDQIGTGQEMPLPPMGVPTFSIAVVKLTDGSFVTGRLGHEYNLVGMKFSQTTYTQSQFQAIFLIVDFIEASRLVTVAPSPGS